MKIKEIREKEGCGNSCRGCEFLSFCSDCENNLCSAYDMDYKNIDETGETFCGECYVMNKMYDKTWGTMASKS